MALSRNSCWTANGNTFKGVLGCGAADDLEAGLGCPGSSFKAAPTDGGGLSTASGLDDATGRPVFAAFGAMLQH